MQIQRDKALIEISSISKYYQTGKLKVQVLKDLSLTIYPGEFVTIMGPSGSGKSTLINVLGFLDNKFEGHYLFEGQVVEQKTDKQISKLRNTMVGFVFQDFNLIPSMTVYENVRLPLLYSGLSARKTKDRVMSSLEAVGLGHKAKSKPSELSGGQKQRVAIARALINQPQFIIADEPTGALDSKTSRVIMDILARLNRDKGVTIVMVTHDPNLQAYANRQVHIVDGVIDTNQVVEPTYILPQEPLTYEEVMDQ